MKKIIIACMALVVAPVFAQRSVYDSTQNPPVVKQDNYGKLNLDQSSIDQSTPWGKPRIAPYSPPAYQTTYRQRPIANPADKNDYTFDAFSEATNYAKLGYVEKLAAWNQYRADWLPKLAAQHGQHLSSLRASFDTTIPKPILALGPIEKWRYNSCLDEAIKAPTETGVMHGTNNCRERFGQ
jgi:hypothetical protein